MSKHPHAKTAPWHNSPKTLGRELAVKEISQFRTEVLCDSVDHEIAIWYQKDDMHMFGKTTRCVSHSISNLLKMEFLQKSVNKKVHRRIKCYQSMRQMLDGGQPVGPSFPFKSIFAVNQIKS